MLQLPNGCRCSELSITPSNWNTSRGSIKKYWSIHYRFYDPQEMVRFPKGKQCVWLEKLVFEPLKQVYIITGEQVLIIRVEN